VVHRRGRAGPLAGDGPVVCGLAAHNWSNAADDGPAGYQRSGKAASSRSGSGRSPAPSRRQSRRTVAGRATSQAAGSWIGGHPTRSRPPPCPPPGCPLGAASRPKADRVDAAVLHAGERHGSVRRQERGLAHVEPAPDETVDVSPGGKQNQAGGQPLVPLALAPDDHAVGQRVRWKSVRLLRRRGVGRIGG